VPATVNIWGGFLVGALEARCLRMGMAQLQVRRLFTRVGTSCSAVCLLLFTLAPTATAAVVAQCAVVLSGCYSGSGFSNNYYEIGGSNTAVLSGVGNVCASIPGLVLPALGVALRQRFNSWSPIFVLAAAVMLLSGQVYSRHSSVEPAEDTLARMRGTKVAATAAAATVAATAAPSSTASDASERSKGNSSSSMSWRCVASDEGSRLERLLRDKCRDLDPARRLSNRLIKDAIKNGEALINAEAVTDKSRVLHEGDLVELVYDKLRASNAVAASNRKLLQVEHETDDLAVVWKPAGVNRELEEAIDQEIKPGSSSTAPAGGKPLLVYRLAKGVAGLLVVAKTQRGMDAASASLGSAATVETAACCFRVLVYGKLDTAGERVPSTSLQTDQQRASAASGGTGDQAAAPVDSSDTVIVAAASQTGTAAVADDDDDDDDEDNDDAEAASAASIASRRAAAVALNRADDVRLSSVVTIRTVDGGVTEALSSGHMSRIDVWCGGWSSGGKHKRALCRHLSDLGYPVVGDERANHAWVKKKGLHLALLSIDLMLTLPNGNGNGAHTTVSKPEPTKFAHTAKRELKFFKQSKRQQESESAAPESAAVHAAQQQQQAAATGPPSAVSSSSSSFVSSTEGLANRVRDLELVQRELGVAEEGSETLHLWDRDRVQDMSVLSLPGLSTTTADAADASPPLLLAVGYRRILLGDHGPYFELERRHLRLEAFEQPTELEHYIERYSPAHAKLYEQLRDVSDRSNPPKEGRYWVANNRTAAQGGYADYRVGLYYISCDHVRITDGVEGAAAAAAAAVMPSPWREIELDHEQLKDIDRGAKQRRLRSA